MRGRLRRLVWDLTGRADRELARLVREQLATAVRGCGLIRELNTGALSSAQARDRMREIEHAGDTQRHELVEEMSRSLTTPIDREDLFRLSRSVDDVLDNLRDFVREMDLFEVPGDDRFAAALAAVEHGLGDLDRAVGDLARDRTAVTDGALAAKKAGNEIRRTYQEELARLLDGELTAVMLKHRELLRRLDIVGLRLGEAADTLADGVMKRRH